MKGRLPKSSVRSPRSSSARETRGPRCPRRLPAQESLCPVPSFQGSSHRDAGEWPERLGRLGSRLVQPGSPSATAEQAQSRYRDKDAAMSPCHIRRYEDRDWAEVRAIFAEGMLEQVPANFWHLLKQPGGFLLLLGGPGALLLGSGSLLLALLALLALLSTLWLLARYPFSYYVAHALRTDMRDIGAAYLRDPGSCFWVAESGGGAVGLVCARAAPEAPDPGQLELLHLSVRREQRGQGVAKALVRTVLRFAQERGYGGVVLTTTSLNAPARRLYESLGFWKSHESRTGPSWSPAAIALAHYKYALPLAS
ncbi:N-acetyltransferase 8F1-like isoform X2 [Sminthopsis crassicaudata]|uniref:N-acetyltransferase 8F1-like isoform X2 n=1 Tax=Sminthopsis crassicaudata TaxID=9301 RepID=UPI003D6898AA